MKPEWINILGYNNHVMNLPTGCIFDGNSDGGRSVPIFIPAANYNKETNEWENLLEDIYDEEPEHILAEHGIAAEPDNAIFRKYERNLDENGSDSTKKKDDEEDQDPKDPTGRLRPPPSF